MTTKATTALTAHRPRIRNQTERSFRVIEVVSYLGVHPCSGITIERLNEAFDSADACSKREPEIIKIHRRRLEAGESGAVIALSTIAEFHAAS